MNPGSTAIQNSSSLERLLEALLFWKGEPMTLKELAKVTKSTEQDAQVALSNLKENLKPRGVVLVDKNNEYMLGTSSEASQLIEAITKEELSKDLGKASLETLSIILYKGPVKRSEIDYVRGVNSNFILRNLLIRGLIDKKQSPEDARASVYSPSFELLSYLGVSNIKDLPNFDLVQEELKQFKAIAENPPSQNNAESDTQENNLPEEVMKDVQTELADDAERE